jgi:hypothetical protein
MYLISERTKEKLKAKRKSANGIPFTPAAEVASRH